MNAIVKPVRDWAFDAIGAWDRFWFAPTQPHTLAMIRILTGVMLFYTHLVWSLDLMAFLGPHSWITSDVVRQVHTLRENYAWSYLWYFESPAVLWTLHIMALVVFAMFTLGLFSRITAVLAYLITVAYCYRLDGALFGLDQINAMLAMYVMLGPCGGAYSIDRLIARWRAGGDLPPPQESVSANVAVRLIQLHMCIIYLFGGLAKMRGGSWWDGSAMWLSIANLEYQSWDMTWMAHYQLLIALLTHVTVFWEAFYCVLVWPRVTRPIVIFLAVCVHSGIALFLGMKTFGLVMLIGNLAFISPQTIRALVTAGVSIFRWEPEQVSKERMTATKR